jgi:iron complex transport system permease protein
MARWTLKRWAVWNLFLFFCLMGVILLALSWGAVSIPLGKSWSILSHRIWGWPNPDTFLPREITIILELRLPRVIAGALVGAGLALTGAVLQALLRNPLADPFVLGISSGGALGAVLAILFGFGGGLLGSYVVPGSAFVAALLTIFFVYSIARVGGRVPIQTMLLAGVIVSSFFSAMIMVLISLTSDERLHSVTFWLMGSLEYMASQHLGFIFLYLFGGGSILFFMAKDFNLMALGEETALELGVDVEKVKLIAFILTSLITGAVVSVSGLIAFVGLIVPHMIRMIWGPDHRFLLPACAWGGAMFLILADTIARTLMAPLEIPVGVITAITGAPFFIFLLRKKGHAVYR